MTPSAQDPRRARYLDFHARCHQAFTPFAPVELPDFFAGRLEIVRRVSRELAAPGRHVAIFGERGVGKTSLAALLYFFTGFEPESVHMVRCGEASTFEDIFADFLLQTGGDLAVDSVEADGGGEVGLGVKGVASGQWGRREKTVRRTLAQRGQVTTRRLLDAFAEADRLLIIDEYDRVRDDDTHVRLAELIKTFSDARTTSKIVVVGVADTLTELVGKHQSLSRSLAQIRLERMSDEELGDIVQRGATRTGLEFDNHVVRRIVRLADGFPQYVHLLALYAALEAIECLRDDPPCEAPRVGEKEYRAGVEGAIENAEHSLAEAWEEAVVTTRRQSAIYELILQAMAMSESPVVQVRDIARHASTLAGEEKKPAQLSTALGRLQKPEKGSILTKVRDGFYKFTNPLMRAYVRLLLDRRYSGSDRLRLPFFE